MSSHCSLVGLWFLLKCLQKSIHPHFSPIRSVNCENSILHFIYLADAFIQNSNCEVTIHKLQESVVSYGRCAEFLLSGRQWGGVFHQRGARTANNCEEAAVEAAVRE